MQAIGLVQVIYEDVSKQLKSNSGKISLIFGIAGLVLMVWFNFKLYHLIIDDYAKVSEGGFYPSLIGIVNLLGILLGILTILFGAFSIVKKKRYGVLGLIIGILILLLVFFPIYPMFFNDSVYDINFK